MQKDIECLMYHDALMLNLGSFSGVTCTCVKLLPGRINFNALNASSSLLRP
jgi:hypothetical protein